MRSCVIITLLCVMGGAAAGAQNHLAIARHHRGPCAEAVFDSFITDTLSLAGDTRSLRPRRRAARRPREFRAVAGACVRGERRLQAALRRPS